jgi:hypothetical protein
MTPYTTVYDKRTAKAKYIYAASLQEFLATGLYSAEPDGKPSKPQELLRAETPTAGREEGRAASIAVLSTPDPAEEGTSQVSVAEEPAGEERQASSKKAPRRRSSSED